MVQLEDRYGEREQMYFDTHAHLDDKAFDEDREAVIKRIRETGVELVLDPGCDVKSSRRASGRRPSSR